MAPKFEERNEIVQHARELYRSGSFRARLLQGLRPFICPFEDLISLIPSTGRVLDIGCGSGLFLGLIGRARPNIDAIGFDFDANAIKSAKAMANEHFPDRQIDFKLSGVGDPWPQGPFKVVSMIDVLHHISPENQLDVVATAYAHVSPGGIFIYKDMADRPFYFALWNRLHDLIVARQWIHYRNIIEVETKLKSEGAEIIARFSKSLGLYGHEFIVARRVEN